MILAALDAAARAALEELMDPSKYEYKSDFARKYVAQGRAEGEAEGVAKGKAEGRAEALLQLVAARGLALSGPQRDAVLACRDLARLERWFARALTASSVEDILASE